MDWLSTAGFKQVSFLLVYSIWLPKDELGGGSCAVGLDLEKENETGLYEIYSCSSIAKNLDSLKKLSSLVHTSSTLNDEHVLFVELYLCTPEIHPNESDAVYQKQDGRPGENEILSSSAKGT